MLPSWSPLSESNRRPTPYHGVALPTELRGRGSHRPSSHASVNPLSNDRRIRASSQPEMAIPFLVTSVALTAGSSSLLTVF